MRIEVHAYYRAEAYLDKIAGLGKTDTGNQRGVGAANGAELEARPPEKGG